MKSKLLTIAVVFSIGATLFAQKNEATSFETTLKYNVPTGRYEVYAKVDVSGLIFLGGSSISVVLPSTVANQPLIVYPVIGTWEDLSKSYDAADGKDYHSVISTMGVGNIPCNEDQEFKLFEFQLSEKKYVANVRLWEKNVDQEVVENTEYISNFYVPHTGYYIIPSVYKSAMPAEITAFETNLYPSVTSDRVTYLANNFPDFWNGNVKLDIYDAAGRLSYAEKIELQSGQFTKTVDVRHFSDGNYKFVLTHSNGRILDTKSFVKMHE